MDDAPAAVVVGTQWCGGGFFRLLHPTTGLLKGFGHGAVTKL